MDCFKLVFEWISIISHKTWKTILRYLRKFSPEKQQTFTDMQWAFTNSSLHLSVRALPLAWRCTPSLLLENFNWSESACPARDSRNPCSGVAAKNDYFSNLFIKTFASSEKSCKLMFFTANLIFYGTSYMLEELFQQKVTFYIMWKLVGKLLSNGDEKIITARKIRSS